MSYGIERDAPIRRGGSRPRAISEHLAKIARPTPTTRELVEAGPETNTDPEAQGSPLGARGVRFGTPAEPVEATRTEPGGVAVVEVPGELDHPDDDSHVVVDPDSGEAELVEREPIMPAGTEPEDRDDGRPAGSLPVPEGGEPDVDDGGEVTAGGYEDRSIARPGTPGTYEPELTPRPGTLLELADAVQPTPSGPWPAGTFVLYGSGKRAHWNGEAWRSGEAPSST